MRPEDVLLQRRHRYQRQVLHEKERTDLLESSTLTRSISPTTARHGNNGTQNDLHTIEADHPYFEDWNLKRTEPGTADELGITIAGKLLRMTTKTIPSDDPTD